MNCTATEAISKYYANLKGSNSDAVLVNWRSQVIIRFQRLWLYGAIEIRLLLLLLFCRYLETMALKLLRQWCLAPSLIAISHHRLCGIQPAGEVRKSEWWMVNSERQRVPGGWVGGGEAADPYRTPQPSEYARLSASVTVGQCRAD